MPKMKSHRGAKKRLKVTASGKIVHQRTGRRHLMFGKNASRRRSMRAKGVLAPGDAARSRPLLPYD